MSLSTFHANFKAATANPPLRYLQTTRLHKAQVLMVSGVPVAEAARRVGYESPSQFSREFKRLFGGTPKRIASRTHVVLSMFRVESKTFCSMASCRFVRTANLRSPARRASGRKCHLLGLRDRGYTRRAG